MTETEERHLTAIRKKDGNVTGYQNHEMNNFILDEDVIGLDANILVDLVNCEEFKDEVKAQLSIGVSKIYTTNIALGEARHVLTKKKNYTFDEATTGLRTIIDEINIQKISHNQESDALGEAWIEKVKKRMYIKKFPTFPNDCKILANLFNQGGINVYFTEDKNIKQAVEILKLRIRVRIIAEAENLNNAKIKDFFNQNRKSLYKKRKLS